MVHLEGLRVLHPLVSLTFEVLCRVPFPLYAGKGTAACDLWNLFFRYRFCGLKMVQLECPMVIHPLVSHTFVPERWDAFPLHCRTIFYRPIIDQTNIARQRLESDYGVEDIGLAVTGNYIEYMGEPQWPVRQWPRGLQQDLRRVRQALCQEPPGAASICFHPSFRSSLRQRGQFKASCKLTFVRMKIFVILLSVIIGSFIVVYNLVIHAIEILSSLLQSIPLKIRGRP